MNYFKVPSLKDRASYEVALNLCQDDDFKEVAWCLGKPTYGSYLIGSFPIFVSEEETSNPYVEDIGTQRLKNYEKKVTEQCQKLTEKLPHLLKISVQIWINRIALEYLSYCRRQEELFGLSRYFLINFVNRSDWTENCRLDEQKLAQRLLIYEQLTVLQRYQIACVNCLIENIPILYKRLTITEKDSIHTKGFDYSLCYEGHVLVEIWTNECDSDWNEAIHSQNRNLLIRILMQLVNCGNDTVLRSFWKKLDNQIKQDLIIMLAITSLQNWQDIRFKLPQDSVSIRKLLLNVSRSMRHDSSIKYFNLPSYYIKLLLFFLSEMHEEQQQAFFNEVFKTLFADAIECFLDWPLQNYFLQTMNRLWGIIPNDVYKRCFLTLVSKYSKCYQYYYNDFRLTVQRIIRYDILLNPSMYLCENVNHYNYRDLLWDLWEETPQVYKQYILHINTSSSFTVNELYTCFLEKPDFEERDEALFKRIFYDLPNEERFAMMNSKTGTVFCLILTAKEKWLFINWLLQQCLPEENVPCYKKQFAQLIYTQEMCFLKRKHNKKFLIDFFDWCFESDSEKTQYKIKLINGDRCFSGCCSSLRLGDFSSVENLIEICMTSDEEKKQFIMRLAEDTCIKVILEREWEKLDLILAWCFDTEENIKEFKKYLFSHKGVYMHFQLVFKICVFQFGDVERFYEWFDLLPEEIKQLKKETVNSPYFFSIIKACDTNYSSVKKSLQRCFSDAEIIMSFKNCFELKYFKPELNEKEILTKKRLCDLVKELLLDFQKVGQKKTSKECYFFRGEKRSVTDESVLEKKWFK